MPEEVPSLFDDLLDLVLRGRGDEVRGRLSRESSLTDSERQQIEAMLGLGGAPSSDTHPEEIGDFEAVDLPEKVGPFLIRRELGSGGMGIVYLAEDTVLKRRVALKVLRRSLAGGGSEGSLRFRREAQAIAALKHPNVVTIYAVGRDGETDYLAMEYLAGPGLDDVISEDPRANGGPDILKAVTWVRDIGRALAAAHGEGIIHRDVKPSNIRITDAGHAVLVDFGLAHNEALHSMTLTGSFRGSPFYASPEQVAARRVPIDHRTDVYSLGVTLYEALTGVVPFHGETPHQVFNQILVKDPPSPRQLNSAISSDLETVILKAMEKDPDLRYSSAQDFVGDLSALLEMRPIKARPAGLVRRTRKWMRRHPLKTACLVGGFLVVAGLLGALGFQKWERATQVRERLAEAKRLEEHGEYERAIATYDGVLGIAPNDPRVRSGRDQALDSLNRARAAGALTTAKLGLKKLEQALKDAYETKERLRNLNAARIKRAMTEEEVRQYQDDEQGRTQLSLEANAANSKVESALLQAERAWPNTVGASALRAELAMIWWRNALLSNDESLMRVFEQRVRAESGGKPEHLRELEGRGHVVLTTKPASSVIYLFQYRRHCDVVPGGDLRQVPVPVGEGVLPVDPGTYALRALPDIAATMPDTSASSDPDSAALEPEVIVIEVAGYPVKNLVLVAGGNGQVKRLDRVTAVDGYPVKTLHDITSALKNSSEPMHRFTFLRGGESFTVEGLDTLSLGLTMAPLHDICAHGSVPVRGLRQGRVEEFELPKGTRLRPTAAPLISLPSHAIDASETSEISGLLPGSYLAYAMAEGYEPQRVTFEIPRGASMELEISLQRKGTTPSGFVYIPPTPTSEDGSGFAIMEAEVTYGEYQRFLDDPNIRDAALASLSEKRKRFVPREMNIMTRTRTPIEGEQKGNRWVLRPESLPYALGGISYVDAKEFAAWRTRAWQATGNTGSFSLPTYEQWHRAGQGSDKREHAWGSTLIPSWLKCLRSRPRITRGRSKGNIPLELPLSYPIDESPFGVFDLSGNQMEWASSAQGVSLGLGGSWRFSLTDGLTLTNEIGLPGTGTQTYMGFRLVYLP